MSSDSQIESGFSPKERQRVLQIVFLTVFLDMIGFGLVLPLMPLYVKSMGGTAQTVGFILSSFSLTQLLATPLLGRLSDRYGRRRVILFSLLGNALAMAVFAAATHYAILWLLFASRVLAGATAGNLSACQAAIADVTSREERAKGMGLLGAGIGLGMVIGPVVGGEVSRFGASAPPLVAAAMALIDVVLAFVLMPETNRLRSSAQAAVGSPGEPEVRSLEEPRLTLWSTLRTPRLGAVIILFFLCFLILTNLQVSLALMAKERFNWNEAQVSRAFALFGFTMLVIQGGLIGRLVKRFGEMSLAMFGACSMGGGMVLLSVANTPEILLGGVFFFAVGIGVTSPSLSSLASRHAPADQQGAALGIVQSAGGLARTVGPTWSGFLFKQLGSPAPFIGGAISAAVFLIVGLSLKARITAPPSPVLASEPGNEV